MQVRQEDCEKAQTQRKRVLTGKMKKQRKSSRENEGEGRLTRKTEKDGKEAVNGREGRE